jgi:hypothetical protein
MQDPRSCCRRGSLVLVTLLAAGTLAAHDLSTTEARVTLGANRFEILLLCDLDALALGAGPAADDALLAAALADMPADRLQSTVDDLANLFARRVRLLTDSDRLPFDVDFPDREAGRTVTMAVPSFLGLTARLRGPLPADAGKLRLRLSRAFPAATLTVIDADGRQVLREEVPRGEDSSEFSATDVAAGSAPGSERRMPGPVETAALVGSALALYFLLRWRNRRRRH